MTKRKKIIVCITLILLPALAFIGYYQVFYTSDRIESGLYKLHTTFSGHTSMVRSVKFSPDGKFVVSGSVDSTVMIWNKLDGKIVQTLKHPSGITYLDYSAKGDFIVTSSYDGKARLWSVSDGKLLKEFGNHKNILWTVTISPDGKYIAGAGEEAAVIIWDLYTGNEVHRLRGHTLNIWSVRFSPDGSRIASGSFDNLVKIWNVSDGKLIRDINGHTEAVVDIAFTHDGTRIASTSDDGTMKLWDVNTGRMIRSYEVPEHLQAVAFSPDDKYVLTGGRDKPTAGELIQEFFGDSEYNKGVSARLWNVETGELLQTFTSHGNDVNDVDYSNDGNWIVTGSEDKTVGVWNIVDVR
jgi:WD40 repeat protein